MTPTATIRSNRRSRRRRFVVFVSESVVPGVQQTSNYEPYEPDPPGLAIDFIRFVINAITINMTGNGTR